MARQYNVYTYMVLVVHLSLMTFSHMWTYYNDTTLHCTYHAKCVAKITTRLLLKQSFDVELSKMCKCKNAICTMARTKLLVPIWRKQNQFKHEKCSSFLFCNNIRILYYLNVIRYLCHVKGMRRWGRKWLC